MKQLLSVTLIFGLMAGTALAADAITGPTTQGKKDLFPPILGEKPSPEDSDKEPDAPAPEGQQEVPAVEGEAEQADEYGCFERNLNNPTDSNGISCLQGGNDPALAAQMYPSASATPTATEKVYVGGGKVDGIGGIEAGGHLGRQNISKATQGGSLKVLGGGVYNVSQKVGLGAIGIARMEQQRGSGAATYSERTDAYDATISAGPLLVVHPTQDVNVYSYIAVGLRTNITPAEMAVGLGLQYHKDLLGIHSSLTTHVFRERFDQHQVDAGVDLYPIDQLSVGATGVAQTINPSAGIMPPKEDWQWGAAGEVNATAHVSDDFSLGCAGGFASHAGLYGRCFVSFGLPLQ